MIDRIKEALRGWLYLPNGTCPICGLTLFTGASFLCSRCEEDLHYIVGDTCSFCGRPLFTRDLSYCGHCAEIELTQFAGGYSMLHYKSGTKILISAIKFKRKPLLAIWLGEKIGEQLVNMGWISEIDCILPVPLHENRIKKRGYNQSEKLAEGIFSILQKNNKNLCFNSKILLRVTDTPHQIGKNRDQRKKNIENAFVVSRLEDTAGKNFLLVDDVITTGSTLRECARVLLEAGANKVFVCSLAAD